MKTILLLWEVVMPQGSQGFYAAVDDIRVALWTVQPSLYTYVSPLIAIK